MDLRNLKQEAVTVARGAKTRSLAIHGTRNEQVIASTLRSSLSDIKAWNDKWRAACISNEDWSALISARASICCVAIPPILRIIADIAESSRKFTSSSAPPFGRQVQDLRRVAATLENVGDRFLRKPAGRSMAGSMIFLLKMGCGGAGAIGEQLRRSGQPLPTIIDLSIVGEKSGFLEIPGAAILAIAAACVVELEKRVGVQEMVPDRDELCVISPVWWRRSLLERVPCVLWLTTDKTLVLRRGQGLSGAVELAVPVTAARIEWGRGCVARIDAERSFKLDFQALPGESDAISERFLGMSEAEWVDSVGSLASSAFAATSDVLKLIDLFQSRRDAKSQIEQWQQVLFLTRFLGS